MISWLKRIKSQTHLLFFPSVEIVITIITISNNEMGENVDGYVYYKNRSSYGFINTSKTGNYQKRRDKES